MKKMKRGAAKKMNDSLIIYEERQEMPKKIRLELPVGAIESDSGNHVVDMITITALILIFYISKKYIDKYFKKEKERK